MSVGKTIEPLISTFVEMQIARATLKVVPHFVSFLSLWLGPAGIHVMDSEIVVISTHTAELVCMVNLLSLSRP